MTSGLNQAFPNNKYVKTEPLSWRGELAGTVAAGVVVQAFGHLWNRIDIFTGGKGLVPYVYSAMYGILDRPIAIVLNKCFGVDDHNPLDRRRKAVKVAFIALQEISKAAISYGVVRRFLLKKAVSLGSFQKIGGYLLLSSVVRFAFFKVADGVDVVISNFIKRGNNPPPNRQSDHGSDHGMV